MKFRILLILCFLLFSCSQKHKVHVYKTHHGSSASFATSKSNDDWLYWYIMYSNNSCYYYSSTKPVEDLSTIKTWTRTATKELPPEHKEMEQEGTPETEEVSDGAVEGESGESSFSEDAGSSDGGGDGGGGD